jgi:hypothetical protein
LTTKSTDEGSTTMAEGHSMTAAERAAKTLLGEDHPDEPDERRPIGKDPRPLSVA